MTRNTRLVSTQVVQMARAPANKMFAALWRKHLAPAGQPPSFAEFNLNILQSFGDALSILQPTEHGDFYYSHFGRITGPSTRGDLTGHFHSEIDHPVADALAECFREVINTGKPLLVTHGNMRNRSVQSWEMMVVPVDSPFGRQIFTHAVAIAFRSDLIGSILQSSPVAILACAVESERTKNAFDLKVQAASTVAEALFASTNPVLVGRDPITFFPQHVQNRVRDTCLKVYKEEEMMTLSVNLDRSQSSIPYDLSISPFEGGLVLTLSDLSALRSYFRAGQQGALLEASD